MEVETPVEHEPKSPEINIVVEDVNENVIKENYTQQRSIEVDDDDQRRFGDTFDAKSASDGEMAMQSHGSMEDDF